MDNLFGDAAERLFSQYYTPAVVRAAERGDAASSAWQACHDAGFLDALVSDEDGGAGLSLDDVLPLFHAAGRHAVCAPLADTVLARAWLYACGHVPLDGSIALAPFGLHRQGNDLVLCAAPWGKVAQWILATDAHGTHLLCVNDARSVSSGGHGSLDADLYWSGSIGTLASFDAKPASSIDGDKHIDCPTIAELAALSYTGLMSGAMERILALTLDYANERTQFGKHIGRFQAVQQQISVMAEQVWSARMAAHMAFRSDSWTPNSLLSAVGKARTSASAGMVADTAHAVHGAMGITEEYDLQRYTRRLREWRRAAGIESYWMSLIGGDALAPDRALTALDYVRTKLSAVGQ